MELATITEAEFEARVLQAALPVIVDFGAEWCHPCKQLEPVLEDLSNEWQGKASFFRIDSDQEVNLVTRYGVMGLPTLILFVGGEPRERLTGFAPKKKLMSAFAKYL
jgi:thioredoxin 1